MTSLATPDSSRVSLRSRSPIGTYLEHLPGREVATVCALEGLDPWTRWPTPLLVPQERDAHPQPRFLQGFLNWIVPTQISIHVGATGSIRVIASLLDAPVLPHSHSIGATTSAPPAARENAQEQAPPAFTAFTELSRWLRLTVDDTAQLVGVGRTTPYTWQRDGREPQPATARRLYQVHALVAALIQELGQARAIAWLEGGEPSPRQLLLTGDLESVMRAARPLIFGQAAQRMPAPGSLVVEVDAPSLPAGPVAGRRRRGRPRRTKTS